MQQGAYLRVYEHEETFLCDESNQQANCFVTAKKESGDDLMESSPIDLTYNRCQLTVYV